MGNCLFGIGKTSSEPDPPAAGRESTVAVAALDEDSTSAAKGSDGWPTWLVDVAGDALKGLAPRRADSFRKLEKIGQGTYSHVYKAKDLFTGKIVALKKVRFDIMEQESARFMAREISILRKLNHPNIIKLEGLVISRVSHSIYLVFEYMEHDLSGLAALSGVQFTEAQVKCYMTQLLSGLEHCHEKGVLHRDIKGSNLLIDDKGILKIADFGLASTFDPNKKQPMTSRVVTLWYRPPELLLGATYYGVGVDLWSAGCILAELLACKPILPGRTEVEQLHKIFKLCGSPSEKYWKKSKLPHATMFKPQQSYKRCIGETFKEFPPCSIQLIETLLSIDPDERGTATAALNSRFFTTSPLACAPSSLPHYPPSKEIDARLCDEKDRRQKRGDRKKNGGNKKKSRVHDRGSKAIPAPQANAELSVNLEEEVYMEQPQGFIQQGKEGLVCKLNKAIYGLKQAPRVWFDKLKATLVKHGYNSLKSDNSIFTKFTTVSTTYILIYVDDFIITGNSDDEIGEITKALNSEFSIKDLGDLNYFLGIEVKRNGNTEIHLSQRKYISEILIRAKMHNANSLPTPMVTGPQLSKTKGEAIEDEKQYRSLVGALQYATITRPDISYSVNKISQYMQNPLDQHWKALKRILRYLKGTITQGLILKHSENLSINAYSDADWATDQDDRKSTSGYCVYLGKNPVSWCAKKQNTVSRSSTEAEFRSMASTTAELMWIKSLLSELKVNLNKQPTIWCDNTSAISLTANPVLHSKTKHIELDLYFIREQVMKNKLRIGYIPSQNQKADILTKPLSKANFARLKTELNVDDEDPSKRTNLQIFMPE